MVSNNSNNAQISRLQHLRDALSSLRVEDIKLINSERFEQLVGIRHEIDTVLFSIRGYDGNMKKYARSILDKYQYSDYFFTENELQELKKSNIIFVTTQISSRFKLSTKEAFCVVEEARIRWSL